MLYLLFDYQSHFNLSALSPKSYVTKVINRFWLAPFQALAGYASIYDASTAETTALGSATDSIQKAGPIGFIITDKGKIVALDGLTTSFGSLAIIGVNKRIGRLRSQ